MSKRYHKQISKTSTLEEIANTDDFLSFKPYVKCTKEDFDDSSCIFKPKLP